MEKIIRIEERNFKTTPDDWSSYDGFEITTDEQVIKIGISDGQSCCESFGCIISEDNISEFIGADLISVSLTDNSLMTTKLSTDYLDEGGVMFVNLETSKGLLQFAAYNFHNGYYGHTAVLVSKQLSESKNV